MPTVTFGSRAAANRARDLPAVAEHLSPSDDRRSTSVKLDPSTPKRITDRIETEAFTTGDADEPALGGMAKLSESERSALESTGRFDWQTHGLAAMRAKGALEARGVTDFTDFYEPGEGVAGAIETLTESKQHAVQTGAKVAVGGQRTDTEEITGGRMQRQQAGRFQDRQVEGGERPGADRPRPVGSGVPSRGAGIRRRCVGYVFSSDRPLRPPRPDGGRHRAA